jgi:hypothetical protein
VRRRMTLCIYCRRREREEGESLCLFLRNVFILEEEEVRKEGGLFGLPQGSKGAPKRVTTQGRIVKTSVSSHYFVTEDI